MLPSPAEFSCARATTGGILLSFLLGNKWWCVQRHAEVLVFPMSHAISRRARLSFRWRRRLFVDGLLFSVGSLGVNKSAHTKLFLFLSEQHATCPFLDQRNAFGMLSRQCFLLVASRN